MTRNNNAEDTEREAQKVRLTDKGLETPDHLVGRTGQIKVEKPEITMTLSYVADGVQEYDRNLVSFPPTDKDPINVPEGHVRIDGTLYEVVDDRELNECPNCGSDKIPAGSDEPKCYTCDTEIDPSLRTAAE